MFLQSINHLKRVYEPKTKKGQTRKKESFVALPKSSGIYQQPNSKHIAYKRHFGDLLHHYGIFSGDVVSIDRRIKPIDSHSLYAVLLPDNSSIICAVKRDKNNTVLHDGYGGNYRTFRNSQITVVGLVVGIEKGE